MRRKVICSAYAGRESGGHDFSGYQSSERGRSDFGGGYTYFRYLAETL